MGRLLVRKARDGARAVAVAACVSAPRSAGGATRERPSATRHPRQRGPGPDCGERRPAASADRGKTCISIKMGPFLNVSPCGSGRSLPAPALHVKQRRGRHQK